MNANFEESKHPRDSDGKFAAKVDSSLVSEFLKNGQASAYRIHDGNRDLPARSRNEWSDSSEYMEGVSGYSSLSAAVADMLLGAAESVTGENYTKRTKNPMLIMLHGKQLDAPGAEYVIPSPKVSVVLSKAELEKAMRDTLEESDKQLPIDEILDQYSFDDSDLEAIAMDAAKHKYKQLDQDKAVEKLTIRKPM
jgi:hypothetical protein